MDLQSLRQSVVLRAAQADVGTFREHARQRRLLRLALALGALAAWLWFRILTHNPIGLPQMTPRWVVFFPTLALIALLGGALLIPLLGAGRSPHVMFRPQDIDISLDDVKGMPVVVEEVVKTLNLFLAHKTFRVRMGGTPRRAMLFEGPPGPARPTSPRPWRRRRGDRSSSWPRRPSSPCITGRPTAR